MKAGSARSGTAQSSDSIGEPAAAFATPIAPPTELRRRITAATRRPETESLPPLVAAATLSAEARARSAGIAHRLVEAIRAKPRRAGIEALVQEYSLSSQEGVALMCLAEALLRIPDNATRDALIRDKLATGDWGSHAGEGRSLFVNAASWGLVLTGRLTATTAGSNLAPVLTRLVARCGEPLIRKAVDMAMRMMGEHFVTGETIRQALAKSRRMEAKGFRYSYDMLGEAAKTADDAMRYFRDYERAIEAIGQAAAGRGLYDGPGISIKLSALHPRYSRSQAGRVMGELLPRVKALALQAKQHGIGLNIDAEEADRLELSLDILEALSLDPDLSGWDGLGFVVQAYGKRCPHVIDFIVDLARRSGHRLMVRLVKGAYWDSEIKRAQAEGLEGFPVYTRKIYTDVSYLACARKLLDARAFVFPQFATHNALSLASILAMADETFETGDYEFQCLHGMGEPLYEEVVGQAKLGRPCRIYAPVGTHETLLAYLVRRLLENGANSSFVNQIANPDVPAGELLADPAEAALRIDPLGAPHAAIAHPQDLFAPGRRNSQGIDLANEDRLAALTTALRDSAGTIWTATPGLAGETASLALARPVFNPADPSDIVGWIHEATGAQAQASVLAAASAAARWAQTPPAARAAYLSRAADLLQARMPLLIGLLMREAGKTAPNAISEVREAVDFLRYYATGATRVFGPDSMPLGPVVCISPWNFPLAIFTGQVAAALVAGNPVLAKPAGETPLIAAQAVALLHEAGIPRDVLQFLPGDGSIGAALVGAPETCGVLFTGSTEVARLIQRQLADKPPVGSGIVPLIAETGGLNAMIVDSSALAEQVVGDVLVSAFDSAGQRCSALRVLCLQDEIADRILAMLEGAMRELRTGRPDRLDTDIGPVISAEAAAAIEAHLAAMAARGHKVRRPGPPPEGRAGHVVTPALVEIGALSDLEHEVFGPVLHVLRFKRGDLDTLVAAINATGYGLTFGLHTRLDETAARVRGRIAAGNVYINRNMVGAVVGSQPFGGSGLSGTGPKAGGPLYLRRLVTNPPPLGPEPGPVPAPFATLRSWLEIRGFHAGVAACLAYEAKTSIGFQTDLNGPSGERNIYALRPRGCVLLLPQTANGLFHQMAATLASGNRAIAVLDESLTPLLYDLPASLRRLVAVATAWPEAGLIDAVLAEGTPAQCRDVARRVAARQGPIVSVHGLPAEALGQGIVSYSLEWLFEEVAVSIDTTAAGGNASLMAMD